MPDPINFIERVLPFAAPYMFIICDLWGVVHDGVSANPEAMAALMLLKERGARIGFLTNAPRPEGSVRQQIQAMGVDDGYYDVLVTSGEMSRKFLNDKYVGAKFYHLGPVADRDIVVDLRLTEVDDPMSADILLCTGLDPRWPDTPNNHRSFLEDLVALNIPMVCANADRAVHVAESLWWCAGALAEIYEDSGGRVFRFGKPKAAAFLATLKALEDRAGRAAEIGEVLVIGDNIHTDIAGGYASGWATLFVADGIHRSQWSGTLHSENAEHRDEIGRFLTSEKVGTEAVIWRLRS